MASHESKYHLNNRERRLEELKMEFMIKAELAAYKSSDPKVKKQTFREKVNSAIYDQVFFCIRSQRYKEPNALETSLGGVYSILASCRMGREAHGQSGRKTQNFSWVKCQRHQSVNARFSMLQDYFGFSVKSESS